MLDWPTYLPDSGIRYNEPFYANLSATLLKEFPNARPHWTKNTRNIFQQALKNLDQDVSTVPLPLFVRSIIHLPFTLRFIMLTNSGAIQSITRFAQVRKEFDPDGTFKSIVGEIIGVMD